MGLQYQEWLPSAGALRDVVTAYWHAFGDPAGVRTSAVLPDGHVELVCNLGDSVALAGPAYTGAQPDRAVVGPLSCALRMDYSGYVNTFGIRFHPARGATFFGRTAASLVDKLMPLAALSPPLDSALARLLRQHWKPPEDACRAALDAVLLGQFALSSPADMQMVAMVDRLAAGESVPPVEQIARELGLSTRQAQRRFIASVGMPPKQFVRVIRFSRLWQSASMRPPETWADLAAEHGYADQAHMVREFRSFGVVPPTYFFGRHWYEATELTRISGPAPGVRKGRNVRSVQDPS